MTARQISAVTLAVQNMARAVEFYKSTVGLNLLYGGPGDGFTSFSIGDGYLNLTLEPNREPCWWGRVIIYVDDVDAMYRQVTAAGDNPTTAPQDAPWGERYFHINDPDGHELSFSRRLDA